MTIKELKDSLEGFEDSLEITIERDGGHYDISRVESDADKNYNDNMPYLVIFPILTPI